MESLATILPSASVRLLLGVAQPMLFQKRLFVERLATNIAREWFAATSRMVSWLEAVPAYFEARLKVAVRGHTVMKV